MAADRKRQDVEEPDVKSKIRKIDIVIHILKTKLSSTRLSHLKKLAIKNGIRVSEEYRCIDVKYAYIICTCTCLFRVHPCLDPCT